MKHVPELNLNKPTNVRYKKKNSVNVIEKKKKHLWYCWYSYVLKKYIVVIIYIINGLWHVIVAIVLNAIT